MALFDLNRPFRTTGKRLATSASKATDQIQRDTLAGNGGLTIGQRLAKVAQPAAAPSGFETPRTTAPTTLPQVPQIPSFQVGAPAPTPTPVAAEAPPVPTGLDQNLKNLLEAQQRGEIATDIDIEAAARGEGAAAEGLAPPGAQVTEGFRRAPEAPPEAPPSTGDEFLDFITQRAAALEGEPVVDIAAQQEQARRTSQLGLSSAIQSAEGMLAQTGNIDSGAAAEIMAGIGVRNANELAQQLNTIATEGNIVNTQFQKDMLDFYKEVAGEKRMTQESAVNMLTVIGENLDEIYATNPEFAASLLDKGYEVAGLPPMTPEEKEDFIKSATSGETDYLSMLEWSQGNVGEGSTLTNFYNIMNTQDSPEDKASKLEEIGVGIVGTTPDGEPIYQIGEMKATASNFLSIYGYGRGMVDLGIGGEAAPVTTDTGIQSTRAGGGVTKSNITNVQTGDSFDGTDFGLTSGTIVSPSQNITWPTSGTSYQYAVIEDANGDRMFVEQDVDGNMRQFSSEDLKGIVLSRNEQIRKAPSEDVYSRLTESKNMLIGMYEELTGTTAPRTVNGKTFGGNIGYSAPKTTNGETETETEEFLGDIGF